MYAGIDLHSTDSYIGIIDKQGRHMKNTRSVNDLTKIIATLSEYEKDLDGIVVESTYNWHWLVDGLMDVGHSVYLANPAAIQRYKGLKHAGDRHDAFFLAEMLRLNILPTGYIYPKEGRGVRDLLRTRGTLVNKRSGLITSLSNVIVRNTGKKLNAAKIKTLKKNHIYPLLSYDPHLLAAAQALKETIDCLSAKIKRLEKQVLFEAALSPSYKCLQTLPGVGTVLGLTIMLETGPIERFKKVGNYVSYCRKVSSRYTSNNKAKGRGNVKNGNRYLAWAYGEAADFARRYDNEARAYFDRKSKKTNTALAHAALAHKLARAAYHMMRDNEPFMPERVFGKLSKTAVEPNVGVGKTISI